MQRPEVSIKPTGKPTPLPSLAPKVSPPTGPVLVQTTLPTPTTVSISDALPVPASAYSKMSPALLEIRHSSLMASVMTLAPTPNPSLTLPYDSPTSSPSSTGQFSFTPLKSKDSSNVDISDNEVSCINGEENNESYHSVELPFYYQLENAPANIEAILREVQLTLLNAIASILSCGNSNSNDGGEDIRRYLSSGKVIAAYTMPDDTIPSECDFILMTCGMI